MQSLGLSAAELPRGMGQAIDMTGQVTFSGGEIVNLRGMTLKLDQNTLTGDADIRLGGAKPQITAKLAAGALDFASLVAEGGSGGGESSAGWSKTTIDASGLAAVNAEVSLAVQSLDAGMIKLGASSLGVSLDNSRLVLKLPKATGYGGQISGEFVVNNRGGLSVGGNLNILQADVKSLLVDLMGVERL